MVVMMTTKMARKKLLMSRAMGRYSLQYQKLSGFDSVQDRQVQKWEVEAMDAMNMRLNLNQRRKYSLFPQLSLCQRSHFYDWLGNFDGHRVVPRSHLRWQTLCLSHSCIQQDKAFHRQLQQNSKQACESSYCCCLNY